MLNKDQILQALRDVASVPSHPKRAPKHRTIYEAGEGSRLSPSGHFFIDYASFPGGTNQEVPLRLIQELESKGTITRAFPGKPEIKAWILNANQEQTGGG